ncbi:hypothetical protein JGU66_12405 [Myxococcaceae bacterium JPH2]|nr:hypothetical protein [Myxococcaceae bacterium JPH2]
MQIYSSARTKSKAQQPHELYYSRTRLIAGAVAFTGGTLLFGTLTWRLMGEPLFMVLIGLITLATAWMVFNCIRALGRLDKPALVISQEGILFEDGMVIAWDDMEENTFINQTYMGLPLMRMVQIKTRLERPRLKKQRVTALGISSDEYLALCDRYSQDGAPPSRR